MSRHTVLTSLFALGAACAGASAQTQTIFQDDFESGLGNWTTAPGLTGMDWSTAQNIVPVGGSRSAYQNSSFDYVYHNLGAEATGLRATWWVYDASSSGQARAYGELRAYNGAGFGQGSLQQVHACGKYNTVTMPGEVFKSNKYQGRVAYPSASLGWFNIDAPGSLNRTPGWHKFDVETTSDGMARFYVDDNLGRTITGANVWPIDCTLLGCGYGATAGDAWFDGVVVARIDNVLSLNVNTPLYRRPGQDVVVKMDLSNLAQLVNGCQALIGYSSIYFPAAGTVVPGGGVWTEMIYQVWNSLAGELDTAVGVELGTGPGGGTQSNGTVAVITLTAGTTEGLTRLDFRPDGLGGYATMLSDLGAQPVWPYKRGSQTILIDGTPPEDFVVTPGTACTVSSVTLTFSTTDPGAYPSGIDYYELFVDSTSKGHITSVYTLDLSTYADGPHAILVRAFDKAGNCKDSPTVTVTVDKTPPTITSATAAPTCVKDQSVTITAAATDTGCAGGTITWEHKVDGGSWAAGLIVAAGELAEGANTLYVRAIDGNGNASDAATVTPTVSKDTTAPAITSATASPACVKDQDVTITVAATDTGCSGGTITLEHKVDGGSWVPGVTVAASELSEGANTLYVRATDGNGSASASFTVTPVVSKDTTPPAISAVTATQGGNDVLCPQVAVQGVVDIYVTLAADTGCAAVQVPTVDVAGISPTTYVELVGTTYHYQVTVLPATANGAHTITVTAADAQGNSVVDAGEQLCVNKDQIVGVVEMDTFRDTAYAFDRVVVFKATNAGGTVLKTWPATSVHFVNSTVTQVAAGTYTLTDVPSGTARLSAKTAWSLRRRVSLTFDGNGQCTGDFTKALDKDLCGGDLDQSNYVNILDYSILRTHWNSYDAVADINGDGQVQLLDYSIMKDNWFNAGDPP